MDQSRLTESNLNMDRTLDDDDLNKVYEKGVREGSLSPVDFMNCSSEDLNTLWSLFWAEVCRLDDTGGDALKIKKLRSICSTIDSKSQGFSREAIDLDRSRHQVHQRIDVTKSGDASED